MREGLFRSHVKATLKASGAMVFAVHGDAWQQPGWPDLQVYHPRWTGHLELKATDGGLRPAQKLIGKMLVEHGCRAFVVRPCDDGCWAIESFVSGEELLRTRARAVALLDQLSALGLQ